MRNALLTILCIGLLNGSQIASLQAEAASESITEPDQVAQMKSIIAQIHSIQRYYQEIRQGLIVAMNRAVKEAGDQAPPEKLQKVKEPFEKYLAEINTLEAEKVKAWEEKLSLTTKVSK